MPLGPPQQRAVLALLLASGGQPVSLGGLVDLLRTQDPPARLYVSTGLALQALDAETGSAVWPCTPPNTGALVCTPAVANGLVFVGSTNDNLYAIRA